jgi:segregation and condensation protein B
MENEQSTTPADLGRTYAAMLGEAGWQVDEPPPTPVAEEPASPPPPMRIIEALLFVGGAPLTAKRAREILRGLNEEQFDAVITQLNHDYRRQARPYAIQPQGHGWILTLRPKYRYLIEKLYGGVREARLSSLAIDVLAIVAYRQPNTKVETDAIRGADSGALLRQLVRRGLIQITPIPGGNPKEVAYATTPRFLEMFGLASLDDLPKTHDLQQM